MLQASVLHCVLRRLLCLQTLQVSSFTLRISSLRKWISDNWKGKTDYDQHSLSHSCIFGSCKMLGLPGPLSAPANVKCWLFWWEQTQVPTEFTLQWTHLTWRSRTLYGFKSSSLTSLHDVQLDKIQMSQRSVLRIKPTVHAAVWESNASQTRFV